MHTFSGADGVDYCDPVFVLEREWFSIVKYLSEGGPPAERPVQKQQRGCHLSPVAVISLTGFDGCAAEPGSLFHLC